MPRPDPEPPRAVVSSPPPALAARTIEPPALPAPSESAVEPQRENHAPSPSFEDRRASRAKRPDLEPSPPNLEAEMKLIRAADGALRSGRTSEALSLLAAHASSHPKGLLSQERRGLEVLARCQSSPGARSRKAAEGFLASAPRSRRASGTRAASRLRARHHSSRRLLVGRRVIEAPPSRHYLGRRPSPGRCSKRARAWCCSRGREPLPREVSSRENRPWCLSQFAALPFRVLGHFGDTDAREDGLGKW